RRVLHNFDISKSAPGAHVAIDWQFRDIVPDTSGQITIQFNSSLSATDPKGIADATVSAFSIEAQWNGGSVSSNDVARFYDQLQQVAEQGYVGSAPMTPELRICDNEMHGLSTLAVLVLGDDQVQKTQVSSLMLNDNRLSATIPRQERFGT